MRKVVVPTCKSRNSCYNHFMEPNEHTIVQTKQDSNLMRGSSAGIYCIVNHITGEFYVGSTVDLKTRRDNHFALLRRGKGSRVLQANFDRHGESAFKFIVLSRCPMRSIRRYFRYPSDDVSEICDDETRLNEWLYDAEVHYIERLKPSLNIRLKTRTKIKWR